MKRARVGGAALAGISLLVGFGSMLDGNKVGDRSAGTGEAPSVPGAGTTPSLPASVTVPITAVPAATSSYDEAVEAAGIARLQADPVDAAIGFLELAAHAARLPPADAAQLQRTITTPANTDAIAAETQSRVAALHTVAPAGNRLWVAPLAATMQPLDSGRVDVRVWHVRAIAFWAEPPRSGRPSSMSSNTRGTAGSSAPSTPNQDRAKPRNPPSLPRWSRT